MTENNVKTKRGGTKPTKRSKSVSDTRKTDTHNVKQSQPAHTPNPNRVAAVKRARDIRSTRVSERKDLFLVMFKKTMCFTGRVCDELGIPRSTVDRWRLEDPVFKQRMDECHEFRKDIAEQKLNSLINDKNPAAVFFFLKCKAKDRGYVERQEVTGADGGAIKVQECPMSEEDILAAVETVRTTLTQSKEMGK